jgi:hypothetical protein
MSQIVYVGNRAGLSKDGTRAGDMNSPFDYEIHCHCKAVLGPLGRFVANAQGVRTAFCPRCSHVTIVDKAGGIKVVPFNIMKAGGA